jgi:hypothetical protein
VVWNYSGPKFRDVAYAVGEFVRSQPLPDQTLVTWTYRFARKDGVSVDEKLHFQEIFLGREFPRWMRKQLDRPAEEPAPGSG